MIIPNKKFSTIRWVFILVSITAVWTGIIFAINYAVNPFGDREWLAEKKYKPIVHERSEKYNLIFNQKNIYQYDCIILGSSRVMSIVPSVNNVTKSCYNFGVHTANNPEKLFILQEWLKHGQLKEVYLGNELHNIHPWMHPLEFDARRFIQGSEGNDLSYSTLQISFKVLQNVFFKRPQTYFKADGSIYHFQDEQNIRNKTFNHTKSHFKTISIDAIEGNFVQHPFVYEEKSLEPLRQIKALCDQHHIKLYPFITPTYYESQVQMKSHPNLINATQRFHHDLLTIFGEVYDFDIDTLENRNPVNFYDTVHYRPIIGNLMINRMHNHGNYGTILIKP